MLARGGFQRRVIALQGTRAAPLLAGMLAVALLGMGCKRSEDPNATAVERALAEVSRQPTSAKAYLALGTAYHDAKSFNDAFAAFSKAWQLDSKDAEAAYNLARTDFELRDAEHGIKMARAALTINPRHAAAHEILGRNLMLAGKPREALQEFEAALRLDPRYLIARLNMVAAYSALKMPKEALAAARDAVQAAPNEAQAHYAYADVLLAAGNEQLAETSLRNAIRLDPKHQTAMLRLAILLAEQGRNLEEARNLAKQAQDIDPGDGTAAGVAAWALYQTGRRSDALMELQSCALANPYNYRVWLLFSKALRAEGFEQEGLRALNQALMAAPRMVLTPKEQERLKQEVDAAQRAGGKPIDPRKILDHPPAPYRQPPPAEMTNKETAGQNEEE